MMIAYDITVQNNKNKIKCDYFFCGRIFKEFDIKSDLRAKRLLCQIAAKV